MENRREYLKRITGMKEIDKALKPGQIRNVLKASQNAELNRLEKEYRKFLRCLNYREERGGMIEQMFLELHNNGKTISSLVNKSEGSQYLLNQIRSQFERSESYYHEQLLPKYYKKSCDMDPSEAGIYLDEMERMNRASGELYHPDAFIKSFEISLDQFLEQLYQIISWVCNRAADASVFKQSVDQEIAYFANIKERYKCSGDENGYDGKNDNPYKNLYTYCLTSYVRDFYILKIPDINESVLPDIKWTGAISMKESYTLQDVANASALITGKNYKKSYECIKSLFQEIDYIQTFKSEGEYMFPDLYLPIMTYEYFRRKNHKLDPENRTLHSEQIYVLYLYTPLLKAKAEGYHVIIEAYQKYRRFVIDEIISVLRSNDDGYLRVFIHELLIRSVCRLSLRVRIEPLAIIEML